MKKLNEIFKLDKRTIHQILLWLIGGLVLVFATEFLLRGSFEDVITLIKEKPLTSPVIWYPALLLAMVYFMVEVLFNFIPSMVMKLVGLEIEINNYGEED